MNKQIKKVYKSNKEEFKEHINHMIISKDETDNNFCSTCNFIHRKACYKLEVKKNLNIPLKNIYYLKH